MFAQQFGGRSLFAEPSLSRSQRVRVDLVEVFGVRCPYWVGTVEWVRDGEVESFWVIDEDDLEPVPGAPDTFVDLAVDYPATTKPPPAGKCIDLEDLGPIHIVLVDYLPQWLQTILGGTGMTVMPSAL